MILDVIQKCPIYRDQRPELVHFIADMDVDCDGSGGNPDHDPYFQPDTTLHGPDGKPLNAYRVPFVVVPPIVVIRTVGIVLGCRATCYFEGNAVEAVVGDIGPTRKVGEGSVRLCELMGFNANPNHGGRSEFDVEYRIWPGQAAYVDGVQYALQPWRRMQVIA